VEAALAGVIDFFKKVGDGLPIIQRHVYSLSTISRISSDRGTPGAQGARLTPNHASHEFAALECLNVCTA